MAPYAVEHGVPDIDATHTWAPAVGDAPPVVNDRGGDPPELPWVKLLGIDGWSDLPELLVFDEPRTYGEGEVPYPTRLLAKSVVYVLEVRAASRHDVREVKTALVRGFGGRTGDDEAVAAGTMTVTPYTWPGGIVWTFDGSVQQITIDRNFTFIPNVRAPYRWGLSVSIKMHNPRFYTDGDGHLA